MLTPLDTLRKLGRVTVEGSPQARALGIELVGVDPAEATLKLPWREDLVGDPESGVIAGGAVTTLLDHTCGQAVWAALDRFVGIATLDLRIDYMRPARTRETLIARAHCYKVTRTIAFVRASAYEADPADPVAAAQASFVLTPDGAVMKAVRQAAEAAS